MAFRSAPAPTTASWGPGAVLGRFGMGGAPTPPDLTTQHLLPPPPLRVLLILPPPPQSFA